MTRAVLVPLTSCGAALPTLPTVVPMCRMAPATIKPQAVLQHAHGTTTSSGWGHRAGPTRSRHIWKVHQIPAIENMLFSAQVSTAAGLWHEDGVPSPKTVPCQTECTRCCLCCDVCQILVPYQACAIAQVCRALSWAVSVFGEVQWLWELGPPAHLMWFHSLV